MECFFMWKKKENRILCRITIVERDFMKFRGDGMSKISNVLNMYILLQGRRMMTSQELADILEVSPRVVKSYRKDLEEAGINISSKKGRHGGYYLKNTMDLKGLGISKEELEALKMAKEAIGSGNHLFATDFEILANKILNLQNDFDIVDYFGKDTLRPIHMKDKERELWKKIIKGLVNKKKIKISYKSLEEDKAIRKVTSRVVHPHGTFDHEGSTYFIGYCELRKEIRTFKLSRIEDIVSLEEKYKINIKYDIKKMLRKSFGIIDDEVFDLKLKISYPASQLVKERQYTSNQKIRDIDEDTIIFEARLKGYQEVKTWVLGMGSKVEVIEPEELKEDVRGEIRKLEKLYQLDQ